MVFLPARTASIPSIASLDGLVALAQGVFVSLGGGLGLTFVSCVRRVGSRPIIGSFAMTIILWHWV